MQLIYNKIAVNGLTVQMQLIDSKIFCCPIQNVLQPKCK